MALSKNKLKYIERFANVIKVLHRLPQEKTIDMSSWETCILGKCGYDPWFQKRHFCSDRITVKFLKEEGWRAVVSFFGISETDGLHLFFFSDKDEVRVLPSSLVRHIYSYVINKYGWEADEKIEDFLGHFVTGRIDDDRRFYHQTYFDALRWIDNIRLHVDAIGVKMGEYYIDTPEDFVGTA